MEEFLEILREVLKGIAREVCAYFFRKNVLENEKTTLRRRKQKGVLIIINLDNNHPAVGAAEEEC
nr:hypothetical protein [Bacillus sp. ISL-75]